MALERRTEHLFSWWHQGVMLFDRDYPWSDGFDEYAEAPSGEWLDQSRSGGVTFVAPGGAVFDSKEAPLTLEVHSGEPPIDEEVESIGEFDLRVTSGVLELWPATMLVRRKEPFRQPTRRATSSADPLSRARSRCVGTRAFAPPTS